MNRLIDLLSHWRGRMFVQGELESRGYMLPRRYQEFIGNACSPTSRDSLDLYWDEETREYICSAGRANTIRREFPEFPCYRSEYLDSLASKRKSSAHFKVSPLHPCLEEYAIKRRLNPEFDSNMIATITSKKPLEMRRVISDPDIWTGEKREVRKVFGRLMTARGFSRRGNTFIRKSACGLVFGGYSESGGRPYCISVPFHLFVMTDFEATELFQFSPWIVVPGFWFYYGFGTPMEGLLGFNAYVDLLDVMSESF